MERAMNPILEVQGLSKRFQKNAEPVVNDVGFSVNPDEIFAILGPSGCGKTTTLRIIAGFERPDSGEVTLRGHLVDGPSVHLPPEKRGIGFVFQEYALFPHLNVHDNIAFGLRHLSKVEREARIDHMMMIAGLKGFEKRKPSELSGGQQQRVALARAIAPMPTILFLDEPFSNLDAVLRHSTRQEVRAIIKKSGISAILVTHDQEEALSFADRIAVMRNGKIEQVGTPEYVYKYPKTDFIAAFLGRTNLVKAVAEGWQAETAIGTVMIDRPTHGATMVSIRPEHLALEKAREGHEGVEGVVLSREFRGHDVTYRVQLKGVECMVHTDNRVPFYAGDFVVVRPIEPGVVIDQ
jgi:iron(III) transport system ATP-binding protein